MHLTRNELERWRDRGGEEDRDRIVTHLAACDQCRSAYVEILQLPNLGGEDLADDSLAAFRRRGLAAWRVSRRGGGAG